MAFFADKLSQLGRLRSSRLSQQYHYLKIIQYLAISLIAILIIFLAMYWLGNGFSLSDSVVSSADDFYLRIDQPATGSAYTQSDTFSVRGGSLGGTLSKVNLWDQAYNVGIPCNVVGTTFAVEIDAGELSPGDHTLVIQGQATDGRWSQPTSVDITITESLGTTEPDYTETGDNPFSNVFQPIYDIVDGVSIQAEEGTGDNDLNGDNIDDRLQASPVSPRYNAFNLPLMLVLIVAIIAIVLSFIIYYYLKYKETSSTHRISLTRYFGQSPERRKWYLKLQALKPSNISDKISNLKKLEQKVRQEKESLQQKQSNLLQKEREIKAQQRKTATFGQMLSQTIQKKQARIEAQRRRLLQQQKLFKKESEIQQKLFNARHKMTMDNLRAKKISLQRQIYNAKLQDASNRSLQRLSSKIASVENQMDSMKQRYERRLAEERAEKEKQRRTFGRILSKLRKEKEELSKQKSVKIFIGPKSKKKQPVRRRPTGMQFIPHRRG